MALFGSRNESGTGGTQQRLAGILSGSGRGFLSDTDLRKSLRAAHIPKSPADYRREILLSTAGAAAAFLALAGIMSWSGLEIELFGFLPHLPSLVLLMVAVVPGTFLTMYYQPQILARGRKVRIDIDLPYAITFMQALSTTTTLYDVIRRVYEESELFGEVSREFGIVVRDVELFGEDLYEAMISLQSYTPSTHFREFLNELVMLSRTGGDVTYFLASRSDLYRDIARRELDTALQTLEILAEVYVTAFVAGPIVVMIMIVAQNLGGQNQLSAYLPMILVSIPAGAAGIIWILHMLLPPDDLSIIRKEIRESEYADDTAMKTARSFADKKVMKKVESRRQWFRYLKVMKHPVRAFTANYLYGAVAGTALGLVIFLLYLNGITGVLFTHYPLESSLCLIATVAVIPLMVAYEIRRHYVRAIEQQMPELLRELVNMKDIGLTLQGAVSIISRTRVGVLSSELKMVTEEVDRGSNVTTALTRMEERIGLVSVKRAISLVVKASEITDYIRDILVIAVSDFEHYLKMKYARFNNAFVYVMIVYLSFGVFLFTVYQLNVAFVASFKSFNLPMNTASNVVDMYWIAILLGISSGLMAGKLSSNSLFSGFKHVVVFMVATILLFEVWVV